MKIQINETLISAYKNARKNPNYALATILSSLDADTCKTSMEIVKDFELSGDCIEIDFDEDNVSVITDLFGKCDASTIEKILWVALLFPEI